MNTKANVENLAYIGSKPSDKRDSNSWYTPSLYVEKARQTMGRIDLDPFSSKKANSYIKASEIFTVHDSALGRDRWAPKGERLTVWMNPPYGRGIIQQATEEFIRHYNSGEIQQAILLLNNATETHWMQSLLDESDAICLVKGRIAFISPDGKEVSGNTRGQVFIYFGTRARKFSNHFSSVGRVGQWM